MGRRRQAGLQHLAGTPGDATHQVGAGPLEAGAVQAHQPVAPIAGGADHQGCAEQGLGGGLQVLGFQARQVRADDEYPFSPPLKSTL